MAIEYHLLCENGTSGTYWSGLSTEEKSRYGSSGSERVYSSLAAARVALNAATPDYSKTIHIEFAEAFSDTASMGGTFSSSWYSIVMSPTVDGVLTSAFHGGDITAGYKNTQTSQYRSCFGGGNSRVNIWGMSFENTNTSGGSAISLTGNLCNVFSNFVTGYVGVGISGAACNVFNNIAIGCTDVGFKAAGYDGFGSIFANNLATGCGTGFDGLNSNTSFINNIGVGNTTNWGTASTNTYNAYNAGETGDTPFGDNAITVATTDFSDYSNNNFYPASSSSPQVNAGIDIDAIESIDIVRDVRPNYESATFPSNVWDIGPYEFDHGEGLAPSTVTLSITGMAEGSALAIYDTSDDSEILEPTTIDSSGAYTDSAFVYTADISVKVVVRKGTSGTKYLPYTAYGTIGSSGLSMVVSQVEDTVA